MSNKDMPVETCEICAAPVPGFEYRRCCSGFDCGCMGQPVEPCVCSEECWDALINRNQNYEAALAELEKR